LNKNNPQAKQSTMKSFSTFVSLALASSLIFFQPAESGIIDSLFKKRLAHSKKFNSFQNGGNGGNAPFPNTTFDGSISDALSSNSNFSTLNSLVKQFPALENLFSGSSGSQQNGQQQQQQNLTVFAPVDSAFTSLPQWLQNALQSNFSSNFVAGLLAYHVHNATQDETSGDGVMTNDLVATLPPNQNVTISTFLDNVNLTLFRSSQASANGGGNETFFVNDATIQSSINTTNGVIYAVNLVLSPLYYLNRTIYNLSEASADFAKDPKFSEDVTGLFDRIGHA
jgi:uncharacterized surface protein with fasciclin (FAS1) repeats